MTLRKSATFLAAAACAVTILSPAVAQDAKVIRVGLTPQENAEERISNSVKLKMRSQSISATVCHQQLGVDLAASSTPLDAQIAEFEKVYVALTQGDASLNIMAPEERQKTLRVASLVTEAWTPVKAAAETIASGKGGAADVDRILVDNLEVLENGHNFTAELVKQYANPAKATFADLLTIVIATRQGMLSQKMSKQSCMVSYSGGDAAKKLGETMEVYEATLLALRDGLPAAGIGAAPTKEIKAGLDEAYGQWAAVKPVLLDIKGGGDVSTEAHAAKAQQLDTLMYKMVDVASLYVDFTRSNHN